MKYIVSIFIVLNISCINKNASIHVAKSEILLDSLMNATRSAELLFHHQIQKISIVEKVYNEKNEIESLFSIIGTVNNDTTCDKGGLFNHFGEVVLFKDILLKKPIAELHFVINGNCEGVYLEMNNEIKKFNLTKRGKELILKHYNSIKSKLK